MIERQRKTEKRKSEIDGEKERKKERNGERKSQIEGEKERP